MKQPDHTGLRPSEGAVAVQESDVVPGTAASIGMWKRVTVTHLANSMVEVSGTMRSALELRVVRHDAQDRPDVRAETRYAIDRATGVLLQQQTVTPMADGKVTTTTSWKIGALDLAG